MILLIVLNFLYALMFVCAKFALQTSNPIFMTATRLGIGACVSLAIYFLSDNKSIRLYTIKKSEWFLLGLLSFINIYAANCLEIWGLQYLSIGKAAFIYNLGPFFSALLAYIFFSEQMTRQKWIGLLIGFLGFLPVLFQASDTFNTTHNFCYITSADCFLVGAVISSVIGWTLVRILVKKHHLSGFFVNGVSLFIGSLLCFLQAIVYENKPFIYDGMFWKFMTFVLIMGLVKYGIAYNINTLLLIRYSTTLTAFFSFTASLFTTILGVYFFQETVSNSFIFSIVTVFFGLMMFYQEELRQGYISK